MLTNPIVTGRIRHGKVIHDGLRAAITPPDLWETVQETLKSEAAKARGKDAAGSSFRWLLTGRVFDGTGD